MAAIGEPIDNSIEASATIVRIDPVYSKDKKSITTIAFADNGKGIDLNLLAQVLKMGYSSRYGKREGLGRFGVGLKLAGLSVGTRIEVITKTTGSDECHQVFLDLDLITEGKQTLIEAKQVPGWPAEHADLMSDKRGDFRSGTLILWQNIDRLSSGGPYGVSLESKVQDMRKFIARVYREFIDNGLQIELAGQLTSLHDPLFLLDNPRIDDKYKGRPEAQLKGRIIDQGQLTIDNHPVEVTVTIAPEIFRHKSGDGGAFDAHGNKIRDLHIKDNQGRITILRNRREIYYDIVPRILPSGVDKLDRYIGIEVRFPAELDEYFQVRHVKRGAEPVEKLRAELREWLRRPIKQARQQIRKHWNEIEVATRGKTGDSRSQDVLAAIERAEKATLGGGFASEVDEEREKYVVDQVFEDLGIDPEDNPEDAKRIREQIRSRSVSVFEGAWPGKDIMDIDHLNNRVLVRINRRHPFVRDVYVRLREMSQILCDEAKPEEMHELVCRTWKGLDMLFVAYAKAENLHHDPEVLETLRNRWGQHTDSYMKELARSAD